MEILESRKAFALSRYQEANTFNKRALERDTAALVLETSGNIHSFFLAVLPDGTVVNPAISKIKDVEDFYADETPQAILEKTAGLKIRQALLDEKPETICAWISPPGGEFNYKEGRFEIGRIRNILGIKVLQSYGIPIKNATPEYCKKLFLTLEKFSFKENQNINSAEDLRDKISILFPNSTSTWIYFISEIFPELSEICKKINNSDVHHLKMKAMKDARMEVGRILLEKNILTENLIYLGARIEKGMEEKGWNLSNGVCGLLNSDLLKMQNKAFFGMVKIKQRTGEIEKKKDDSLEFKCPNGHLNKREQGKYKKYCSICGCDVSCGIASAE